MSKSIVVFKDDDTVVVVHPAYKTKHANEDEDVFLERIYQKDVASGPLAGCDYVFMDAQNLPDRTGGKRDKWRRDGQKKEIKIDNSVVTRLDKQKNIQGELQAEYDKSDQDMDVKKVLRLEHKLKTGVY